MVEGQGKDMDKVKVKDMEWEMERHGVWGGGGLDSLHGV